MSDDALNLQKEIVMLLAILVKRDAVQTKVILEMGEIGFSPKRIAELLNTTSNTVSVALHHARKSKSKKTKAKQSG